MNIALAAPIAEQQIVPYEYSSTNLKAIGQLPPRAVGGNTLVVEVPPMSILRFDVKL